MSFGLRGRTFPSPQPNPAFVAGPSTPFQRREGRFGSVGRHIRIPELEKRIKELEEALKAQADAKAAKKPARSINGKLHYDIARNQPGEPDETKEQRDAKKAAERKRPNAGRIPSALKTANIQEYVDIYPDGYTDAIAKLICAAAILYVDETGWKIGKKHCYTWVFATTREVLFKVGVGRGKDVLTELLGEHFSGKGVTDDDAAYDSIFAEHQLCWAHPLRKAIELSLRYPNEAKYRRFVSSLFNVYYEAVRISKDETLSQAARKESVRKFKTRLKRICRHHGVPFVTANDVEKAKSSGVNLTATPEPEAKFVRLQKQLVEKSDEYFVFVLDPNVESTNNRSERTFRGEAETRKCARTSKTKKGADRRAVIKSVLSSLKLRLQNYSLRSILEIIFNSLKHGVPLFTPPIRQP